MRDYTLRRAGGRGMRHHHPPDTGAAPGMLLPDWLARRAAIAPDRLALIAGSSGDRRDIHARIAGKEHVATFDQPVTPQT